MRPDYAEAHSNRGNTLQALRRFAEAVASYDRAIAIRPDFAEAHGNRGNALQELKQPEAAADSYRHALAVDPRYMAARYELGFVLQAAGRNDEARAHLEACLAADPADSRGIRLLLARSDATALPAKAPEAQMARIHQERSAGWDAYRQYYAHDLVAGALRDLVGPDRKLDILDAGCGTGLVGGLLRDLAGRLDGLDSSQAMLDRAAEKQVYDSLIHGDLVDFMHANPMRHDAIASAATLIHFGDLRPVFAAVALALRDTMDCSS